MQLHSSQSTQSWWSDSSLQYQPLRTRCLAQILDQQVEVVGICRAWIKIEMFVEAPGAVVLGVNNHCTDTRNIGCLKSSGKGIMQQGGSQSVSLGVVIDSEPGQQHHGDGMTGALTAEPAQ